MRLSAVCEAKLKFLSTHHEAQSALSPFAMTSPLQFLAGCSWQWNVKFSLSWRAKSKRVKFYVIIECNIDTRRFLCSEHYSIFTAKRAHWQTSDDTVRVWQMFSIFRSSSTPAAFSVDVSEHVLVFVMFFAERMKIFSGVCAPKRWSDESIWNPKNR